MVISVKEIYQVLFKLYGPQGWWPLIAFQGNNPTMRGRLTGYHPEDFNLPRTEPEMLEIMLGAILTQNTSWINAEKALFSLKEKDLIDIPALKNTPLDQLGSLIRSSGYYNQKAIKIHALVQFLLDNPIASLLKRDSAVLREDFLQIKGVGPETCDSILLYALKKPIFVVDTYTRRLMIRMGLFEPPAPYEEIQQLFQQNLERSMELFNEYHALIVQHAVHCCLKEPLCDQCPFQPPCQRSKINASIPPKKRNLKKSSKISD
jgi:endonuclease-3 related protein